jgi:hypothetical protein
MNYSEILTAISEHRILMSISLVVCCNILLLAKIYYDYSNGKFDKLEEGKKNNNIKKENHER